MKRQKTLRGAACPTFRIESKRFIRDDGEAIAFRAVTPDGETIGATSIEMVEDAIGGRDEELAQVSAILVRDPYRRCGVGTKLYEAALKQACAWGVRLSSDITRSPYSQGFWQKQVKKGRATCAVKSGGAERIDDDGRVVGRWDCRRYALKRPCPADMSLKGVKRKPSKKTAKRR